MSESTNHHAAHDAAEIDRPPNVVILIATLTIIVTIGITIGILSQVYTHLVDDEYGKKVLELPNTELRSLRIYEAERLTRYQWVDQTQGVLRIPLERAEDLILHDYAAKSPAGTQ